MRFANDIEELIYLEYQDIDAKAYQSKIRYYEQNKKAISQLPYELRLEMSLEYVVALFEVGEYYQYLQHVDKLLTRVIEDNIFSIDGDDIYQELLYRKGASLYNIVDYYGADHVLSELCKIDKENDIYRQTFKKNKIDSLRYRAQKIRAVIISMFLVAGVIIGVELLVIRPFFMEWVQSIETTRNLIFGAAVLGIILQELRIRLYADRQYKNLFKRS